MNILFPILLGAAGTIAGWIVYRIVGRYSKQQFSFEQHFTIGASALFMLSLAFKLGETSLLLLTYGSFGTVLIGVALFDFRTHQIPLWVTVPGTIAGPILAAFVLPFGLAGSLIGLVFGGGVLIVTTLIEAARKKEVGGGDWKYAAMIGSFVGWPDIVTAMVFTGVFGMVAGLLLKARGINSRPQALGPWLSLAACRTFGDRS